MGGFGGPEKDHIVFCGLAYVLSPQILLANCMSFSIMVTLFVHIAHKLVSLNNSTKYTSTASCNAITTAGDTLNTIPPCSMSCTISCTKCLKGALLIKSSVDFWYLLISLIATVPGLYLLCFPSVLGSLPLQCLALALAAATFLASFWNSVGAPVVAFLAVCLVLAMLVT